MTFTKNIEIGLGIYTLSDIVQILQIPRRKANRWLNRYWNDLFISNKKEINHYSWKTENSKAIHFQTLVEFYVFYTFSEKGVPTRNIVKAHQELAKLFETDYPFATKRIIENLSNDGKDIIIKYFGDYLSLDGKRQYYFEFMEQFYNKLEFEEDNSVSRLFPMGKDSVIVVDPEIQFGHPVINGTNIYPQTIFNLYKAGETPEFIAILYELESKEIQDAIEFCQAA